MNYESESDQNIFCPHLRRKFFLFLVIFLLFSTFHNTPAYAAESLYFLHQDHLGSTSLVTNQGGEVVSQQVYYPYGSTRNYQAPNPNYQTTSEHQYTSQISAQPQTGLYYYNARYYNPQIAKFTQADTVQGPNRYLYVGNNPIKHTDPTGHACEGVGSECTWRYGTW